jgi:hypothetical protein
MAYIGNVPAEKYSALTQQTFSSPTGTSFTLDQACTNSKDIALFIDNVRQNPASYSVSGTSLTTSTISSPSTMYCIFNGRTTETVNPPDDSVGLSQMASATDGNLITFDASGNPAYVATGSSGQVLTSAGAGAPPTFSAAPSHTGNVAFPATQVASADANTLDDYEEGTWTPVLDGASTTTYNGNTRGHYVKIGKLVYVNWTMHVNAVGDGSATAIAGLPFTCDTAFVSGTNAVGYHANLGVSVISIHPTIRANNTIIDIYGKTSAGATTTGQSVFVNSARLDCMGVYQIA